MFKDKRTFLSWYWFPVFGTVIALLSATLLHFNMISSGLPSSWFTTFVIKELVWLVWSGLSYVIFLANKRLRLSGKSLVVNGLFHTVASICTVSLNVLFYSFLAYLLPVESFQGVPFFPILKIIFFSQFEWFFIMYWAIVIVSYAFDFYQRLREQALRNSELETDLLSAQLNALKMQLHPHFLFNTLNTISAMIRQKDAEVANAMLIQLSDFLRSTLLISEKKFHPLKEEVEFIQKYLSIECIRFGDKLQVEYKIPEELNAEILPNMILQPLVENAIYHGVSKQIATSKLVIEVFEEGSNLIFEIWNGGPQLDDEFDATKTKGIGLNNTFKRLMKVYEGRASFELKNHNGGVVSKLKLPYLE